MTSKKLKKNSEARQEGRHEIPPSVLGRFFYKAADVITGLIAILDTMIASIVRPTVFLLSIFMSIGIAYGIFARTVLGQSVLGLEELVLMAAVWLYMLGAGLASRERTHLCGDFIPVLFDSPKVINFFSLLSTSICLVLAVFILTWSYDLLSWAIERSQTTSVFRIPYYAIQSSFVLASVLFILYLVRDFIEDLKNSFSHH